MELSREALRAFCNPANLMKVDAVGLNGAETRYKVSSENIAARLRNIDSSLGVPSSTTTAASAICRIVEAVQVRRMNGVIETDDGIVEKHDTKQGLSLDSDGGSVRTSRCTGIVMDEKGLALATEAAQWLLSVVLV